MKTRLFSIGTLAVIIVCGLSWFSATSFGQPGGSSRGDYSSRGDSSSSRGGYSGGSSSSSGRPSSSSGSSSSSSGRPSGFPGGGFPGGGGMMPGSMMGRGGMTPGGGGFPGGGFPGGGFPGGGMFPGGFPGGGMMMPGMMPGGGPPGGSDRMVGMIRALDTNGDGKIDINEIPEFRRPMVAGMLQRYGLDINRKSVTIAELEKLVTSGGRSGANSSTAPLVPFFGEDAEAYGDVLNFGQAEPVPAAPTGNRKTAAPKTDAGSPSQVARDLMAKLDRNKNGFLDNDAREWRSLPFDSRKADRNFDGRLSMSEIVSALGGSGAPNSGYTNQNFQLSMPYDRMPEGVPSWFYERDKDMDGQLTMMEFAGGQQWSDGITSEFEMLDTNIDGLVTVEECFEKLRQMDEEKMLQEEQARRDSYRRGATPPSSDGEQPAPQNGPDGQPLPPGQGGESQQASAQPQGSSSSGSSSTYSPSSSSSSGSSSSYNRGPYPSSSSSNGSSDSRYGSSSGSSSSRYGSSSGSSDSRYGSSSGSSSSRYGSSSGSSDSRYGSSSGSSSSRYGSSSGR